MGGEQYRYLTADDVWAMNVAILQAEGDTSHLLSFNALESAVMRPAQAARYQPDTDLAQLATLLISGITLAHPFLDGNKRTAAIAGMTLLRLNGYRITPTDETLGRQVEALVTATGDRQRATDDFTAWLRSVMEPIEQSEEKQRRPGRGGVC